MNYHPTGLVLHPDVMTMIENVHYLVNNNLPVNKFVLSFFIVETVLNYA